MSKRKPQFKNTELSWTLPRKCQYCGSPHDVQVFIPAGTATSAISQSEANNEAMELAKEKAAKYAAMRESQK